MPLFDVQPIRDLGQQWVDTGERLFEYLHTMHGSVLGMTEAWTGRASRKALQVWTGVAGHNVWTAVWQSAYVVRAIGEAILQYADELQKTMEEIQKARLVEGLTALFGMLIGVAAFGAAGVIGGLLSVIGRLSQTMVAVVSRLTSATSLLGRTAAFTTESIINAAATLGGDLLAQYAGSKAAGVPFKVDWEGAGINMGLGVWMGAGITGPHLFPGAASKVEGLGAKVPVRDLPTNVNVPLPRPGSVGVPKPPDGLPGIPNLGNWNLGPYNTTKLVTSAGGAPAPSVTGGPVTGVTRSSAGTQGVHVPDPGVVQGPRNAVSRTSAAPARPGTPVPETAAPTPVRPSGAVGGEQRPVTPLRGNETPVTGTPQAFLDAPPRSVRDGSAEPPAPHPVTQGTGTAGRNAVSAGGNEVPVPDPVPAYGGNTQSGNTQSGSTSAVRGQGPTVSAPVATGVPDTPSGAGATGLRPGAPARSEAGHALWEAGRTDADGGSTAPVVPNGHETAVTGRTGAEVPRNLQGTSAAEAVRGRSTEPPLPAAASPDRPAVGGGRSPSGPGEFGEPRGTAAPARGREESTVPVRAETRTGAQGPVRSEATGTGPLGGAEGLSPAGAAGSRTTPGSRAFADLVLDRLSPEQQAKGIPEREAGGRYQTLETQYRQRYGEGFPQTLSAEQRASVVARSLRDPAALPDVFDSVRNGTFTADGPSGDRRPLSTSAERRTEAGDRATSGIPGAGGQLVPATAEPSLAHTTADTAAGPAGAPEPPAPTARNTPEPTPPADGPAPALRPRTDDPARAELWTALRQEQEQRYTSVLEAEERLLTHQRELDAVWHHAHETFARGNPTAAENLARDSHEAFAARRKWRDDITGAFQDEVRESGHVSGDAFDRIVGTAKENAYKYLVRAERTERFTTQFKERVSAYRSDPDGLGGHLPQFDTVPTRYLYDAGLGLYVRDDSAAHGLPGSPGGRPRPGPDGEGEAVLPDGVAAVDHFRDKSHDFNPLEQHYLGKLEQLDAVFDTYIRDHVDTRGTLSPEQTGRLDALLDDAYAGIDRVAVRERDLHDSTAHAFEDLVRRYTAGDEDLGTGAENPTYNLGEEAVGRVRQEFRRDLRVVHEAVHAQDAADVSGPGSGRAADGGPDPLWHEAVSQALGGVETRLRHEEFVQYRLAEETGYAERALAALPEDAAARLGTDGRLRVVAEYLDAVRVAAGRHHTGSTRTDGNTGGGPRESWTAVRDTLRATLPERVRHEGDLRHLVAGSAGDFHRIAGHPDGKLSFRVPDETVAKLGDDFRTERVTEYDALFAPEGHRTDVWLAHESVHGSGFRSALENLRTGRPAGPADRPDPGPGPAGRGASGNTEAPDRPAVPSDDPSAPGGTDPAAPVRQGRGDDPATAAPTPPSTAGRQAAAGMPETARDVPAGGGQTQALADPRHAAGGPGTRSETVSAPGRTAGDRVRQALRDDAHGERFRTLVDGHLPRGHRDGGLTTRDVAAAYDEVGALYGHELLGRAHEETRAVAVARHLRGEDLDGFFADLERRYTAEGPSLTERVNSAVDHTFTRAEVEQAHRGLLERHPFLADLSDRVRAKAVAAHLARPMDELAQATRSLLAQRHGIVLERVAPVQRVHRELTERFGARFTALPVGERAAVVAEELRYERSPAAGRDENPVAGPVEVGRRTAAGPPRTVDTGTLAEAVEAPVRPGTRRPGTRRPAAPETTTGPTAAHPVTDPSVPERSGASRPATDHADAPGVPPENLSDVDVPPVGTAAEAAVPDGSDLGAEDVRIDAGAALTEARDARDAALSHFVDAEERHLSGVGGSAEADGSRLARAWERFVDAEALLEAAEEGWARTTGGAPLPEVRDVEARPGVLPGGSRFTDGLRGLLRRPKPAATPEGVVLSVSPLPAAPHMVIDAAKARRLLGEKGYLLVPTSRDLTVAHWLHHPGRAESEFAADAEALAGARATAVDDTLIGVLDTRIASLADDFALFRRLGTRQVWDKLRTPQTAALVMVERRGLRSLAEDRAELMSRLRGGAWPWAREYLLGGDTDAVLEPLVDSVLRHLRDDLSLTVNVDLGRPAANASSTLDAMLQDTTVLLRNAWETMSGNDRYLSQVRGPAEESLGYASVLKRTRPAGGTHPDTTGRPDAFLAPDDLDRSLLPVYAALTSAHRPQALPQYGSAVFHLKHEVIERATLTPTDSFGLGPRGAEGATGLGNLVPLLNHGAESLVRLAFAEATGFAFDARSRRLRDSGTLPSVLQGYFEAQIHGRVTWQDLERVVLFHHAEDENQVREALGQKQALEAFARDQGFSFTVETAPVVQGEQPLVPGTQPPREPVPVTDPVVHESFDELHFVASLLDERGVPHEGLLTGDVPSGRPAGATASPAEQGERGAGAAPSRSVRSVDAVLGRGVRVLDRAGLEAVAGEVL
ncbi:hypothetical protein ACIO8H_35130, partial [Streptomyces sp. NPDC087226]|uniref:hypothetical protein n=1 Tax=Streptomyces sp. NPDC087226 TaxID=3365771 RepID=UPI0038246753